MALLRRKEMGITTPYHTKNWNHIKTYICWCGVF
jgi:hypothetical protein